MSYSPRVYILQLTGITVKEETLPGEQPAARIYSKNSSPDYFRIYCQKP